jgi:hypothetical protein
MSMVHASGIRYPGDRIGIIALTSIQFNMNPRQKTAEL